MAICNCPPGTVIDPNDPTKCIGTDEIPPTGNPTSLILKQGWVYSSHNQLGALLYEDVTNQLFPLVPNGGSMSEVLNNTNALIPFDNNGSINLIGDPWQTLYPRPIPSATNIQASCGGKTFSPEHTHSYGRLGAAGVLGWEQTGSLGCYFFNTGTGSNPDGYNWHGFQHCLEVPITKQYIIAVAANNYCRFKIDDVLIYEQIQDTLVFKYLKLFPITLTAGIHVIKLEGADQSAGGSWVAEIYDLDATQIRNITSVSELESAILFSTGDFIDQEVFTLDDYECPPGYTLDVCDGTPKCIAETEIPFDCCYELFDCVTGSRAKTKSDFNQYVGKTVEYAFPNSNIRCFSVKAISCLCETSLPSPLAEAKSEDFIFLGANGTVFTAPSTIGVTVRIQVIDETTITYKDAFGLEITVILAADSSTDIVMFSRSDSNTITNLDPSFPLGPLPQDAFVFQTSQTTGITLNGIAECTDLVDVDPSGVVASFDNCTDCLPKCYRFEDCNGGEPDLYFDDSAAQYLNSVVKSTNPVGTTCYRVVQYNCLGGETDIGTLPIDDIYENCPDCLDSLVSYNLIPCDDTYLRPLLGIPKTEYDLEQYLGKVIRINGNAELLYTVELGSSIVAGLIDITQIDVIPQGCPECDPKQRFQEPNINFNCDIRTVLKTKCDFADSVYAMFKRLRYGIETCCDYDLDKIDMRNSLLDLKSLKDPELCNDLEIVPQACCPQPCFVTAMIQIPQWIGCEAPENVTVNLTTT